MGVGTARWQYTGSAGNITNCQIGVFAAYVSHRGHAFIDRSLYLPKGWASDAARLAAAHVPEEVGFATKPAIATAMAKRAITGGVPFAWVAADSVYGVGELEMALRRAGKGYVLGVHANHGFRSWSTEISVSGEAQEIAKALRAEFWQSLSAGSSAITSDLLTETAVLLSVVNSFRLLSRPASSVLCPTKMTEMRSLLHL